MLWKKPPEVIVVGAGPVGLVTALSLVRRGVRIQIIDEAWRAAAHSYALALHSSSLALFDELGVLGPVLEEAHRVRSIGLYERGERRAALDLSVLSGDFSFVAVVRQNRLEELLVHELMKHGVRVQWSHRLARIDPQPDHVEATIHRLDKESLGYALAHTEWCVAGVKDYDVPFVIGCDGHSSLVRRQLGIEFPAVGPAQHFAVFECETRYDFDNEMCVMLNEGDANAVWPLAARKCRFSFELPGYDRPKDERFKNRLIVELGTGRYPILEEERLEELLVERAPWFDGPIDDIDWRLVVRFERRLADRFGRGRAWLAGDAAHMTGPVGIQSMNVGLREGHQLAQIAADAVKGRGVGDDLARYEAERQAEWRKLHGLDGELTPGPNIDPWIAERAPQLRAGLPASGKDFDALARTLGFEV